MIPVRNAVDAHAQDFIVKNKLLISIVKHSYNALAHYKLLRKDDVFSLCAVVEQPVAPTNSSPLVPPIASSPRTTPTTHSPPHVGIV